MKIPGLTIRVPDQPVKVINNSAIRFARLMEVPAIPAPDTVLEVPVAEGVTFSCTVTRSEWHDDRAIFIVSCKYAKARISPQDYNTLINSADWTQTILGA